MSAKKRQLEILGKLEELELPGPSHHFSRGFREILVSGTGEDCCVSSCTR